MARRKTLNTFVPIMSKNSASVNIVFKYIDVGQELRLFVLLASLGRGEVQSLFRESREAT